MATRERNFRWGESGNIYGHSWRGLLRKWDRDGKPLTFGTTGKHTLDVPSPMTYQMRGMYLHP